MNKNVFFIFVTFLLLIPLSFNSIYGAKVEITSEIGSNYTTFTYIFNFNANESYSTVSLEKPRKSEILSVKTNLNEDVEHSVAGDYFIFKPEEQISNGTLTVKFRTPYLSSQIVEKQRFDVYFNFNVPISELTYRVIIDDLNYDVSSLLPRNYNVYRDNEYVWEISEVKKDLFFSINFENKNGKKGNGENSYIAFYQEYMFIIYILSFILIIFVILLILKLINKMPSFSSNKEKESKINRDENENNNEIENDLEKNTDIVNLDENKTEKIEDVKEKKKSEEKTSVENEKEEINEIKEEYENLDLEIESNQLHSEVIQPEINNLNVVVTEVKPKDREKDYKEFLEKYLTENEKEVVEIVRKNQGITQNEILNFLPKMKKSNLSKIVSKLNSKDILNKIRVGKITKIYFGKKLEEFEDLKD